ncbi:hypothetical protein KJ966_07295 [bacterium]|nr:hypothetical protein [bacterium]
MKNLLKASKFLVETLRVDPDSRQLVPALKPEPVEKPDIELTISNQIINELLLQNLPFETSIPVHENKQIKISISDAEVRTKSNNLVELKITDAAIQFDQSTFKVGIKSNTVAVELNPGIIENKGALRLVAHGRFSSFDVKYMPLWLEKLFVEVVRKKFLSPLVDIDITKLLTIENRIDVGITPLSLALKPEVISIKIDEKGISLQARFNKLVQ